MEASMDVVRTNEILDLLRQQKESNETLINEIEKRISGAPEGYLRMAKKWNKYQYYRRTDRSDKNGKYIPRKDIALVRNLARKDYDNRLLDALKEQQKAIVNFLKDYDPDAAQEVFVRLSEQRKQLVKPEFLTDSEFAAQWQREPYEKLGFSKTDAEYYTAKGERVRSKSEILIADALYRNNIPYRYEYPVYSHGVLIAAPDFNCLNVRLRKEYYWEHLGMLGQAEYADRTVKKIEKYVLADDFDETRLILTMETDSRPLNTKVIEEKIRKFLK